MKKIVPFCFLFVIFLFVNQTNGQTPSPTPKQQTEVKPADEEDVVRITSNLIQVDVVVTDKKGKPVTNLKPEDFEIYENDKKQNITTFSYVGVDAPVSANAPKTNVDKNAPPVLNKLKPEQVRRSIALVVDDLHMAFDSMYWVRKALKKFVDEQMQPGDFVAIVRTSSGVAGETAPLTDAAVRQFKVGDTLMYGYFIYNAKANKGTNQQQVKTQLRLFRDGKEVFAGEEAPFDFQGQTDLKRLLFRGTLRLGSELEPGEYVLQIVATDLLAKEKQRTATTWIEFEIVK